MRFILALLIILAALSACATVPKQDSSGPVSPPDLSRPNFYSIYHYLCASFVSLSDLQVAIEQYQLALSHDPASPQIMSDLLKAKLNLYTSAPYAEAEIREVLNRARLQQVLDIRDLHSALFIYEHIEDAEGVAWVLGELESRPQDATGLYVLYNYHYRKSGIADRKKIKQIIDVAEDKDHTAWTLAYYHLQNDPQITLELLNKYPNDPKAELLMLETLIRLPDFDKIGKRFAGFEYPQDAGLMQNYMDKMRQNKRADLILPYSPKILATADKTLIAMLAELAYYASDAAVIHDISSSLLSGPFEPQMDTEIAPTLIAFALQHQDATLPVRELCERIASLNSALSIGQRFFYSNIPLFQEDATEAQADFRHRVQNIITDPPLQSLLLTIDFTNTESPAPQPHIVYIRHLINSGLGTQDDFNYLMAYAFEHETPAEVLRILRQALQKYPTDPQYLNDLGYLLLDYPEHWDEAEKLISRALDYEPNEPSFLDSMAWLQYLKGNIPAATQYIPKLTQNVVLKELNAEVLYHIGMIHLANQNPAAAKTCLEAIGDTGSKFRQMLSDALETQQ